MKFNNNDDNDDELDDNDGGDYGDDEEEVGRTYVAVLPRQAIRTCALGLAVQNQANPAVVAHVSGA